MKNLSTLLALFIAISFVSCSDDDKKPTENTAVVTAKINGTDYRFDRVNVVTEDHTTDGFSYTDVLITATMSGDASKTLWINLEKGVVGNQAIWYVGYLNGDSLFERANTFAAEVTQNESNRVVGTFSGEMTEVTSNETIPVTQGTFDVKY